MGLTQRQINTLLFILILAGALVSLIDVLSRCCNPGIARHNAPRRCHLPLAAGGADIASVKNGIIRVSLIIVRCIYADCHFY